MSFSKIAFARWMHKNPTPTEAALWNRLKGRQLGVGFLPQECILGYVVDFYCPKARLAVELDGKSHDSQEARARDANRNAVFERHHIAIVRVSAEMSLDDQVLRIERKLGWLQTERDKRGAA